MKQKMKLHFLLMAVLCMGASLCFTACDNNEDSPPLPDVSWVEGLYGGKMYVRTVTDEGTASSHTRETTEGTGVTATVKDKKVCFDAFPLRDILVTVVGEEQAEALLEAIGTMSYEVAYEPVMEYDTESVRLKLNPQPLKISIPTGEDSSQTVEVQVSAPGDGSYSYAESSCGKLTLALKAESVTLEGEPVTAVPPMELTFELQKALTETEQE